jgi:AcrR family transcriptional regulator
MKTTPTDAMSGRVAGGGSHAGGAEGRSRARRLPSGAHGIPPELVAQNQRERIVAAIAEVCAERGYVGTTVGRVVERAGVSSSTFYVQFGGLQACLLASFWELFGRLIEEIDRACEAEPDPAARPRAALRRALELFAADPPAARLLNVEILAAGTAGARAQHEAIGQLAERLGINTRAGWGLVALAGTLVSRRIMAGEAETLPELEAEFAEIVLAAPQALP